MIETLASIDREKAEYQQEVGTVLAWLADTERALGNVDRAIALRERQIASLNSLLSTRGQDTSIRSELIPAHRALGHLWTSRGELEHGIDHYRMALAEANRLVAIEPTNSVWQAGAANSRLDLAFNLLGLGRREEAAQLATVACGTAAALRKRDASVATWRTLQTNCVDRRARVALASGATAQALSLAHQAVAHAREERSGDPVTDSYRVAASARLLGDIRLRTGNLEAARGAWAAGLTQLPARAAERPWEMNERAQLLLRLGRGEEAKGLSERLSAMRFRSLF
jgi:tetratricopeptide (TPR) repeat protein